MTWLTEIAAGRP